MDFLIPKELLFPSRSPHDLRTVREFVFTKKILSPPDSVYFHIGTTTKNRAQINLTELNNQSRSNLRPQILLKLQRLCAKPSGLIWLFRLVVVRQYNIHCTLANTQCPQLLVYFMHEKRKHVLYVLRSLCKRENMPHLIVLFS